MAGLADLLEAYKNYRGVQEWKRGKEMEESDYRSNMPPGTMERAMNLWGGFDTGGLAGAIKTYHGTPRREPFTQFDLAHMGSGEGMQAYGQGHYVAEVPSIAKMYTQMRGPMYGPNVNLDLYDDWAKEYLTKTLLRSPDNTTYANLLKLIKKDISDAKMYLDMNTEHLEKAKTREPTEENLWKLGQWQKKVDENAEKLSRLRSIDQEPFKSTESEGPLHSIYEASLEWPGSRESVDPMSREHFFQWDEELKKQPKHVKEALMDIIEQHPNVADPYAEWLAKQGIPGHTTHSLLTLQPQATIREMRGAIEPLLYERGVPGVAYANKFTRKTKKSDRTYNYAVFGDEIPRIISHNKPSVLKMLWPEFNQ